MTVVRGQISTKRIDFSDHAVERYIVRHRPELSYQQALAEPDDLGLAATPLKRRTLAGQALWQAGGEPPILLVVKPDRGVNVCVTVLPPGASGTETDDGPDDDEAAEMIAAYQRLHPTPPEAPAPPPAPAPAPAPPVDALPAADAPTTTAVVDVAALHREIGALKNEVRRLNGVVERAQLKRQKDLATAPARHVLETELRQVRAKLEAETKRLVTHGNRMEAAGVQARSCLRTAILALTYFRGTPIADGALDEIRAMEPSFLSEQFLSFKKKDPTP